MVPSPSVVAYAERHGVTPEEALSVLEQYQHRIRGWDSKFWVFGVQLADGSSGACESFKPVDSNDDLDRDMLEVIQGKVINDGCKNQTLRS
jgi:hypothetical protein